MLRACGEGGGGREGGRNSILDKEFLIVRLNRFSEVYLCVATFNIRIGGGKAVRWRWLRRTKLVTS